MDGWVGGWKDGKAGLRIAYSNQKSVVLNFVLKALIIFCYQGNLVKGEG